MNWDTVFQATKQPEAKQQLIQQFDTLCEYCQLSIDDLSLSYKILITLRNLCAGEPLIVRAIIQRQILFHILEYMKTLILYKMGMFDEIESSVINEELFHKNILILNQFFANFVATSSEGANELLFSYTKYLSDLIALTMIPMQEKIIAITWNIFYNMICPTKDGYEARMSKLLSLRSLLCQLFLTLTPKTTQMHPTNQTNASNINLEHNIFEFPSLFIVQIVQQGRLTHLFQLLSSTNTSDTSNTLTKPCQITFEHILFLNIYQSLCEQDFQQLYPSQQTDQTLVVQQDSLTFLQQLILHLHTINLHYLDIFDQHQLPFQSTSQSSQPSLTSEELIHGHIHNEYLLISLRIISQYLLCFYHENQEIKEQLIVLPYDLLTFCLQLLVHWDIGSRSKVKRETPGEIRVFSDLRKEIIKLSLEIISNLVYLCPKIQNLLVENQGINMILSYCATDFDNPLTREWALLTVRNACADNSFVQEYIDSLKPQNITIEDEQLKAKGMQVELNQQTGKFKVTINPSNENKTNENNDEKIEEINDKTES